MRNPDQQYIAYPANTIRIIQSHDFQFLKKYGQNFLTDQNILEGIVNAAEISKLSYLNSFLII